MIMKVTIRNTENYAMHILVTILVHKKLKRAKMSVFEIFSSVTVVDDKL